MEGASSGAKADKVGAGAALSTGLIGRLGNGGAGLSGRGCAAGRMDAAGAETSSVGAAGAGRAFSARPGRGAEAAVSTGRKRSGCLGNARVGRTRGVGCAAAVVGADVETGRGGAAAAAGSAAAGRAWTGAGSSAVTEAAGARGFSVNGAAWVSHASSFNPSPANRCGAWRRMYASQWAGGGRRACWSQCAGGPSAGVESAAAALTGAAGDCRLSANRSRSAAVRRRVRARERRSNCPIVLMRG